MGIYENCLVLELVSEDLINIRKSIIDIYGIQDTCDNYNLYIILSRDKEDFDSVYMNIDVQGNTINVTGEVHEIN